MRCDIINTKHMINYISDNLEVGEWVQSHFEYKIENWKTNKIHINRVEDWCKKMNKGWVGVWYELYTFFMACICKAHQAILIKQEAPSELHRVSSYYIKLKSDGYERKQFSLHQICIIKIITFLLAFICDIITKMID